MIKTISSNCNHFTGKKGPGTGTKKKKKVKLKKVHQNKYGRKVQ